MITALFVDGSLGVAIAYSSKDERCGSDGAQSSEDEHEKGF